MVAVKIVEKQRLILTLVLLYPLFSVDGLSLTLPDAGPGLESGVRNGQEISKQMQAQLIEERLSAYILSKGQQLELDLLVSITTEEQNGLIVPAGVDIFCRGSASVTSVETLTRWIESECGLSASRQNWRR